MLRLTSRAGLALLLTVAVACAPADRFSSDGGTSVAENAARIATGAPEDVGMSADVLARIGPAMQRLIDEERTGGIMTLVARGGTIVHWEANGWRILGEDPLEPDDIFRIYSMTKPITSTAAMMLVEEGLLELDQPVSDVLPGFADVQVYEDGATRAPTREITIRDLLRHTSGLTYGIFGDSPVDRMYVESVTPLSLDTERDLEATVDALDDLPLIADPGTLWNYSMSTDVLGRVVEVVSGVTLRDFFHERIFTPLGMTDTDFHVVPDELDRFVAQYSPVEGSLRMIDSPIDGPFTRPPSWYSGGGGLTSTASDYLRFAQMLLDEGELDGVRILEPETVRAMRTNQLAPELIPISVGAPVPNHGFGLGFAVSVGGPDEETYWWAGVASTWFWIDPIEEIIAFAWTQYSPFGGVQIDPILRGIVAESLVESNRLVAAGGA